MDRKPENEELELPTIPPTQHERSAGRRPIAPTALTLNVATATSLHPNETKFIELHEQTQHKLEVMRREFGAYLGTIAQAGKNGSIDASRIFIVDVCSGAGSHLSLENPRHQVPGTAVQACIEARAIQRRFPNVHVSVRLIDIDSEACARLGVRIAEFRDDNLKHPEFVDVHVIDKDFTTQILPILRETLKPDGSRYCSLWFIDPFGTKIISKRGLFPLLKAGRGIELIINLDASGIQRIRAAINSENSAANVRQSNRRLLAELYGDDRWDVAVPADWDWERECEDIAQKYRDSFVDEFAHKEVYPLRASDGQVRFLIHLTHVARGRIVLEKAYSAASFPRKNRNKALSITDRDKCVESLFRRFANTVVPFEEMVRLPDCRLDRGQLATVLRRAADTGHGVYDQTARAMRWNAGCMKPPALPLDFAQHTEKKRAKKVNVRLNQLSLLEGLFLPK